MLERKRIYDVTLTLVRPYLVFAVQATQGVKNQDDCPELTDENKVKLQEYLSRFDYISFPGSAWECMTWRLCLHYGSEFQTVTGQSPVDIGSQAEPGNQVKSL
jgi:hypothetical protein